MLNLFQHLLIYETLKQVQGDNYKKTISAVRHEQIRVILNLFSHIMHYELCIMNY